MAELRNLGQPFGSPGRIINIPAPSGSALAGQIQMQSMEGLGQALGAYLGQRKQNQLWEQDQPDIQNFLQSYAASQQPGFSGPPPQLPEMQSRRGQEIEQSVLQSQLGGIFGDKLQDEYTRARIDALRRPEKTGTIDQRLRAAEILLKHAGDSYDYEESGKLMKRAKEITESALEKMDPKDTSQTGLKIKERAGKIKTEINKMVAKRPELGEMGVFESLTGSTKFGAPKTKTQFDRIFKSLRSLKEQQAFIDANWRPEFGSHVK